MRRLAWRKVDKPLDMRAGDRLVVHEPGVFGGKASHLRPTIWQKVRPGGRLWVRETWSDHWATLSTETHCEYKATASGLRKSWKVWRPSIHMSRWASRITLEVTATKLEGLQDISEEDAQAEGFSDGRLDDGFGPRPFSDTGLTIESPGTLVSAGGAFQMAWAKLHPDWDGYSSPEVVALTFTVHHQNIDSMEAAA